MYSPIVCKPFLRRIVSECPLDSFTASLMVDAISGTCWCWIHEGQKICHRVVFFKWWDSLLRHWYYLAWMKERWCCEHSMGRCACGGGLTIDRGNSGARDPRVECALSRYTINASHALIILRLNRGRCLEGLVPPPTANLMNTRQVSAWPSCVIQDRHALGSDQVYPPTTSPEYTEPR